jgi:NAD+ kinase
MRRVGLVVNGEKATAAEVAERMIEACRGAGVAAEVLGEESGDVEAVIGVGGDGTVLSAAALAIGRGIPIAGINVGRVGYLAEFEIDEVDSLAAALAGDRLVVLERMTVEVTHRGRSRVAVNDVVLEKAERQRIIEIAVAIDGHHFATYRTDGIIVATPVGSTAYSLSAGGPVVDPDIEAIVLTPVAPHSLLSRSLVLDAGTEVSLSVAIDRPAQLNVDGREFDDVDPGATVVVRRGPLPVRFLTLGGHPFPTAVRHQFGLDHA